MAEKTLKKSTKSTTGAQAECKDPVCGADKAFVLHGLKTVICRSLQEEEVTKSVKGEKVPTGEFQFNATAANKALELLGKHLGMFAPKEQDTAVDFKSDIEERLRRAGKTDES